MTHPDDDPQLRWNPDAPAPRSPAPGSAAPNGWVRDEPAEPAPGPATPAPAPEAATPTPDPKPIEWGRPTGADPSPTEPAPAATSPAVAVEPEAEAEAATGRTPRHRRRKRERDRVRSIVEWVAVIVGALVVALVVKTFLFQAFYIPSASMEPTLEQGDRVLVNKLSYDLHDINRGDVVVFERPDSWTPAVDGIDDLIKRVIGLPGETVELRGGDVYVDGEEIEEPYLPNGTETGPGPNGKERWEVPDGHIFVMGDNRGNSSDSRFYEDGFVAEDLVVGRAFVQVWPLTDVGGL